MIASAAVSCGNLDIAIDDRLSVSTAKSMDIKLILPLLKKISKRIDCDFFKEPFNYAEVGFFDYPHIIQCPMAISDVINSIEGFDKNGSSDKPVYTIELMLKHTRLIWKNAMIYNAAGSFVYNAAKTLSNYWETQWPLVFPDYIDIDEERPPQKDDIKLLSDYLQMMDSTEMANLIKYLDENNPMCLFKLIDSNEIQINLDLIQYKVCHNLLQKFRQTEI